MASLTVRDLEDEVRDQLRRRAAAHGRSMEAEVRAILREAAAKPAESSLGSRINARFAPDGGVVLPEPERTEMPSAAELE